VVGALIGQIVPIVISTAQVLGEYVPLKTPGGISLLIVLAIGVVLLLCFAAGLLARRSLGKQISENFEKYLLLFIPRYAIIKDQMAGSIGGDQAKPQMKPVLARLEGSLRIGFETERSQEGLVAVYLPGSPDPWSGHTVLLRADRVESLDIEFGDAVALCEQLGRGSTAFSSGTGV